MASASAIFEACEAGRLDIVQSLVPSREAYDAVFPESGAAGDSDSDSDSYEDKHPTTCLHVASKYDRVEVVRYLVEDVGVETNVRNEIGDTPLLTACRHGASTVFTYLCSRMSPDAVRALRSESHGLCSGGQTVLHAACSHGSMDIVRFILDNGMFEHIDERDDDELTPFLLAAQHGNVLVARELISRGADPTAVSDTRETALHLACQDVTMVTYLVNELHLDIHAENGKGATPLHDACRVAHWPVVEFLCSHGARSDTALHALLRPRRQHSFTRDHVMAIVKCLVETAHVDPRAPNAEGDTPLDLARSYRHFYEGPITEYLENACQRAELD